MNVGWETIMNNVVVKQNPRCCFSSFISCGNSLGIPREGTCDYQDIFFSNPPLDLSRVRQSRHTISIGVVEVMLTSIWISLPSDAVLT